MKHILFFMAVIAAATVMATIPEFLVTGNNPTRLEKMAESELCSFYQQIYGKPLTKIEEKDAQGKTVIFLGNTEFAQKNGIKVANAGKEEWILKTVEESLIISGGRPAGSLYGVYELLEQLGVAFLTPDETTIPEGKPDFPKFNEQNKPALMGRLIYDDIPRQLHKARVPEEVKEAYRMWILRNRINGQAVSLLTSHYVGDLYNLSTYPYHNLGWYVDPDIYFQSHPEYFQMDPRGHRVNPETKATRGSLCMSNPEVKRITLETLRGYIKRDRTERIQEDWPLIYDISELDATPYICRCPDCKKIIDEDGSETGLLLSYINHIAREIRKEYPEIIIRTSARGRMPGKLMPEENVLMRIDNQFSRINPFIPLNLDDYPDYKKFFNTWVSKMPMLHMWDYWNLGGKTYFTPPRVETVFDSIQPDLKLFLRNKIVSMFYEISLDRVSPQNFMMLNFYVTNHLMVNPEANVEKLSEQFFRGYYGTAAPVMFLYFNLIREGIKNSPQKATSMAVGHWQYLTPQFMLALYQDFRKAEKALPADSRFAARVRYELVSPIWYTLANWHNFESAFTKAGITKGQLIDECRKLSREYVRRYGATRPEAQDKEFEERFKPIIIQFPRPEKFKEIQEQNFRMITYMDFRGVKGLGSAVTDDSESIIGKALKSSNTSNEYHGVDILLPGEGNFRSTEFALNGNPGQVKTILRDIAQDEQYHWYRIPGSIELHSRTTFWGHGWAIQGRANHWYTLTDGNPKDNTWEQVWFSAKFTGPAYVQGSQKENAIYVDMVVLLRNEKDPDFAVSPAYETLQADGKLPKGWKLSGSGVAAMTRHEEKGAIEITAGTKDTRLLGPVIPCSPNDVIQVKVRSKGTASQIGLCFFNGNNRVKIRSSPAPDTGYQNEYIFNVPDLKSSDITGCCLVFLVPAGEGKAVFDQIEVSIARNLNCFSIK